MAAADTHLQAVELLRDPSHVRDYSEAEWQAMLAQAGFVLTAVTHDRLRMDFADWIARMRTTPDRAAASSPTFIPLGKACLANLGNCLIALPRHRLHWHPGTELTLALQLRDTAALRRPSTPR